MLVWPTEYAIFAVTSRSSQSDTTVQGQRLSLPFVLVGFCWCNRCIRGQSVALNFSSGSGPTRWHHHHHWSLPDRQQRFVCMRLGATARQQLAVWEKWSMIRTYTENKKATYTWDRGGWNSFHEHHTFHQEGIKSS